MLVACGDAPLDPITHRTDAGHDAETTDAAPPSQADGGAPAHDGGKPPAVDASIVDASTDAALPDPATFACNLFIGVSVTGDWFAAGFEDGLDGDRWEAKTQTQAFVEHWANPNDPVWSQALTSACPHGSTEPDRVIFTGVNWTFTGEADWETQLTAVVETLKAKYGALREIDLMTMLRAPGNKVCGNPGSPEQVVQPFIDEAIAAVVAKYAAKHPATFPALVRAAPAFYAPSCDVFLPNSPHFAPGGAAKVAKIMRDYYATH